MSPIRAQTAWLLASCLASSALGLPQNAVPSQAFTESTVTESAVHVTVTDHVTQTDHTLVTDTVCANTAQTPVARIEIDLNINTPGGQNIIVDAHPGSTTVQANALPAGPSFNQPYGAHAKVIAGNLPAATNGDSASMNPSVTINPTQPEESSNGFPQAYPPTSAQSVGQSPGVPGSASNEPGAQPESPHQTLQPAVHWDHDLGNINNLKPVDSHSVYYTPDGAADANAPHQWASVISNTSYPAVVLEHSEYIVSTKCEAGGFTISFSTPDAAKFCQENWPSQLLLVTSAAGCSGAEDGGQAYFLSSNIDFNGLEAVIKATELALKEAVTDMDLSWGHYQPNNSSSAGSDEYGSGGPDSSFGAGNSPGGPGGSTSGGSGNSTNSTLSSSCGAPPAPTISGLPTAPCGDHFDEVLDDTLGFMSFAEGDFSSSLKEMAPGLNDTNPADYDDLDDADMSEIKTRSVGRRGIGSFFKKVGQTVASGVKSAVSTAGNAVKTAATTVVQGAVKAVNVVADVVSSLANPSIDKTFGVDLGPKNLVDSDFGPAYQLYKKERENKAGTASGSIALYCVDCGVKGKIHVAGQVSFSLLGGGLSKGQIGMDGDIEAGLHLGLAAEAQYNQVFKTPIASAGIPGLTIPNIITVGPVLKLDASLEINIGAEGKVLAGTKMTISNFGANLDIVNGQSSANFKPVFTNRFEASGSISAEAGLGLPITVGVGLTIPPIKFDKLVSVIDTPSVRFSAKYAISNTDTTLACNNGITYAVNLANDLTYDLFGFKQGDIFKYKSPDLVSGCKQLGSSPIGATPAGTTPTGSETEGTEDGAKDTTPTTDSPSTPTTETPEDENSITRRQATGDSKNGAAVPDLIMDDDFAKGTTKFNESDYMSDADYAELLKLADEDDEDKANSDGSVYTQIHDTTGKWLLSADDSGSFNLVPAAAASADAGTTFVSFDNITTQDDDGRLFYYFPETLAVFGASRLRLADPSDWPRTADIVTLAPLNYDDSASTPGVYVAADSQGRMAYTVVCNIRGQVSKVFLVSDPSDAGLEGLKREELQWTVIGGTVEQCFPVALMSKGPGL